MIDRVIGLWVIVLAAALVFWVVLAPVSNSEATNYTWSWFCDIWCGCDITEGWDCDQKDCEGSGGPDCWQECDCYDVVVWCDCDP